MKKNAKIYCYGEAKKNQFLNKNIGLRKYDDRGKQCGTFGSTFYVRWR